MDRQKPSEMLMYDVLYGILWVVGKNFTIEVNDHVWLDEM